MFDQLFANIATGFSEQFGGPFQAATARWQGAPTRDSGGSITTPGSPITKSCRVQVCAPADAMRADAGFIETDMRLVVLTASLDATLDTGARIIICKRQVRRHMGVAERDPGHRRHRMGLPWPEGRLTWL